MGKRFGDSVLKFVEDNFSGDSLKRISFVGHSLGGLIIRAGLEELSDYKSKMHIFLTYSTPHLGCMHQSSKLVSAGMWFLKKWNDSKSLAQLELEDSKDLSKTFLYKLSENKSIGWFRHVLLFSSIQDKYSPYESSRVEIKERKSDSVNEKLYAQMAQNLLSRMNANTMRRIDVIFKIGKSAFDTFIGREAHIEFLINVKFLKMLFYKYGELFSK